MKWSAARSNARGTEMLAFATYIPQPLPYLELHAVWLKQPLAHQDPPYLHMVRRFIDDKLPAKVGLLLCTQLLIGPSRCWKMAGGKFPLLGPCSLSLLGACILQCLVPLLAAGVLRWFAPFLAACPLVVCVIPGCICDSVARGCWQHVSFVGTPAVAHSWGLDTYAKSHFLGILRQLERNWQAQDINDSERPSLKTCLFAWQLAACPIKTQRGTSPAGEPSFHLAESNPSPNRTCIYGHCPSSITHFQTPPRFPLSLAHLFRLLLEGTTGWVTFCGECQRKQGKTN